MSNPRTIDGSGGSGTASNLAGGTIGQVPYQSAADTTLFAGPGTSGQVLTSNGIAAPTYQSVSATGLSGIVPVTNGGTGQNDLSLVTVGNATNATNATRTANVSGGTLGQIPYQVSPGSTGFTGPGTAGQVLISNGAAQPTYGAVDISTSSVTGTLPVANGGTGQTSLALVSVGSATTAVSASTATTATNIGAGSTGQIPYQTGAGLTGFITPGASGTVLKSNGAGAQPTFQTISSSPTFTVYASGSGNYTSPAGCSYIIVEMCGGGGGGGKNNSTNAPGGGAGGGFAKLKFAPGTYAYQVGTGGAGSSTNGIDGTAGGNTIFGSSQCNGGAGGPAITTSTPAFGGLVSTTGSSAVYLAIQGGHGSINVTGSFSPGGNSFWGVAGLICANNTAATGYQDGSGYGQGGCGVNNNISGGSGGAGVSGRIIITEYY